MSITGRRTHRGLLACVAAASIVLTACGGGGSATAAPSTVVITKVVTEQPTTPSEPTPSEATPSDTTPPTPSGITTGDSSPAGEPSGPPVIRNITVPKVLTLADIFAHLNWEEGVYQVPRSTTGQQAIGTTRSCYTPTLEVRLAEPTGTAQVTVAQALDSKFSDVTLEFKLLTDGRLVDTKIVKFNQSATLKAPLTGVSALTLSVARAKTSRRCEATAVITDFRIVPA